MSKLLKVHTKITKHMVHKDAHKRYKVGTHITVIIIIKQTTNNATGLSSQYAT